MSTLPLTRVAALALLASFPAAASAQFGQPGSTNIRERITGDLLSAAGAPTPESGDEIGVFFGGTTLVGRYFFGDSDTSFSVVIFGDNPSTTLVEGPKAGEQVEFRFYDQSTNQTRNDVRVENLSGQVFAYRYAGEEVQNTDGLPIPIDLTPTRQLNLRVGATTGGGGDGGGDPVNEYDVDANGKVNTADAAMVLRLVTGGVRNASAALIERADVNGDGSVTTADAIAVMQNR